MKSTISRALESLCSVAEEIIVVDAGSTDLTTTIAREHGAVVKTRKWTNYSDQRNFAAGLASHYWILAIDADEELSRELCASISAWKRHPPLHAAYEFPRLRSRSKEYDPF